MHYGDEEIIRERVAARIKQRHSIYKEVIIGGEKHKFCKHYFVDFFSMVIPESFTDMPDELADIKYPSLHRPRIILSNADGTVNITLSHETSSVELITDRVNNYRSVIKKLNPSNVFFTQGVYDIEKLNVGHYDFRSPTLGKDIYNIHVLFDIDDSEMFLGFNCPVDVQKLWEPLMREMIKTIKPLPEKEV